MKNSLNFTVLSLILLVMCHTARAVPSDTPVFSPYYPAGCLVTTSQTTSTTSTPCICVQDMTTKDVWYTNVNNTPMSWIRANAWANGLNAHYHSNFSGTCGIKSGWRLPNLSQLQNLLSNQTINSLNNYGFNLSTSLVAGYWGGICYDSYWCNTSSSMGLSFYFINFDDKKTLGNIDVATQQLEGSDTHGAIAVVSPTGILRSLY